MYVGSVAITIRSAAHSSYVVQHNRVLGLGQRCKQQLQPRLGDGCSDYHTRTEYANHRYAEKEGYYKPCCFLRIHHGKPNRFRRKSIITLTLHLRCEP